jgi:uncharacterized protein (DUF427 family)
VCRAIWNGIVLAESEHTVLVEGDQYFPPEAVHWEHLRPSTTRTHCFWKGVASYYHVVAGGHESRDAAWFYPDPLSAAHQIRGHVAFWRGVRVERPAGEPDELPASSLWHQVRRCLPG